MTIPLCFMRTGRVQFAWLTAFDQSLSTRKRCLRSSRISVGLHYSARLSWKLSTHTCHGPEQLRTSYQTIAEKRLNYWSLSEKIVRGLCLNRMMTTVVTE